MDLIAPFIALMALIVIARIINERSYRYLTPDQKAVLFDLFSKFRIYGYIIIVVIIFILFALPRLNILSYLSTIVISVIIFLLFSIVLSIVSSKKLHENNYPKKFITLYIISMIIRFGGLALFLMYYVFYHRLFR